MTNQERAELLDWASACQSAYHIDNTAGHRFAMCGSNLQENRDGLVEFAEELIAQYVSLPSERPEAEDGWISTGKKMPPEHVEVLIAISTGKTLLASYWQAIGFDWATTDDDDDMEAWVTHWMPLPKPPALAASQGAKE